MPVPPKEETYSEIEMEYWLCLYHRAIRGTPGYCLQP
jgi:hypothetical protein